jgi:murein L,D-transpeptidase YafK
MNGRAVLALLVILGGAVTWALWPEASLPAGTVADKVVLHKSARVLELYRGSVLIRTYRVSLGRHPLGRKTVQGDGRTPEGTYTLDYRNEGSSFHKALHISYPSKAEVAAASARGVDPGGLIMLHGIKNHLGWLGRAHRLVDWTDGCVAVTDAEIDEIWRVVPVGTPIVIEP